MEREIIIIQSLDAEKTHSMIVFQWDAKAK